MASKKNRFRNWVMGAILFFALLAMVITGFGTGGIGDIGSLAGGQSGVALASVDDRTLQETEVTDVVNREFSRARREQPTLGMAEFITTSFNPIVDQLVLALAVQAFGEAQGLVVSDRMIDREIVKIPGFRDAAGQFDQTIFRQRLAQENLTEAQLREDIRRSLMQRQLLGPVARGVTVPEGLAREYANLLLERRRGMIGVVPTELLAAGINPTDAQVAAFYQQNRARFIVPERRVLKYAVIGPEQVAAAIRATDAEVAAYYQQNAAAYGPRETRDLQHIVLSDQAAAQRFVQSVRSGSSFVQAAAAAQFSAADVTANGQSREQFARTSSAEVASAVFSAEQGALVGPVRSPLGFHLARVERINRSPGRPLETVRAEIAQAIEQRKTAEAVDALVSRVEDRISEGASLEEVARTERLALVTTPPLTEAGQVQGQPTPLPPELQPLLRSAFEIDAEEPEPVVETIEANQRFALLGVDRVIAAAPPPLAQIRDQVRAALIQQQALARARTVAQQIVARINGGMPAAQAFAQAQPRLPAPQEVDMQRTDLSQAGQQVPPPLITLFSLPQGRAHLIDAPNGQGWFVIHHVQRTPGDAASRPELIASTRTEFSGATAAELAEQFARAVERSAEVSRNTDAIQRVRQRLVGSVVN